MAKRFLCLCMSPAIDALVRLDCRPEGRGEVFKDVPEVENAGGKGLNVARWLARSGAAVACGGVLGIDGAAPFEREMAAFGIADRFVRVAGPVRRNEMFTWPGGAFKVNRAAFPGVSMPAPSTVLAALDDFDALVLSGSLPPGCPPSFYADCIAIAKSGGKRVALDASGEALRLGVAAGPDLVKPNADECADALGFVPKTAAEFARATAALRNFCGHVIISDGERGAWFDGTPVAAPKVEVVDTTAAGDALLAEYLLSGDPVRAVAAGSAACTVPGSVLPPFDFRPTEPEPLNNP